MSCGAADFWEATGLPEKHCAHSYCIPALRACTSTVHLTLFRLIRFDLYIYQVANSASKPAIQHS